jgi:co-chaperonin GroES (HSP10)
MSKKIKSKIKNTSGWKCVEYRILILPDVVEEKTKGGIILPSKTLEDKQQAKTIATIISFGSKAFDDGTWKDKPCVGDRIIIPTYCGYRITSNQTKDGKEYRSILDRDIVAMQISEETCQ